LFIQVGIVDDLANNYLTRICQVFGLRYVPVICASSLDDVSLGGGTSDNGNAVPSCARELQAVIRNVIQEHNDELARDIAAVEKSVQSTQSGYGGGENIENRGNRGETAAERRERLHATLTALAPHVSNERIGHGDTSIVALYRGLKWGLSESRASELLSELMLGT